MPEYDDAPAIERPFRLYDSLCAIVRGHALLDDRMYLEDEDYRLVRRLALDSMPENRRRLLRTLLTAGYITREEAGQVLNMTEEGAIKGYLDPLERLGLLKTFNKGTKGNPGIWRLADQELVSTWAEPWAAAVSPPRQDP